MIGLRGWGCEWSGGDMHRGGELGEGTNDRGPDRAQRGGRHRREDTTGDKTTGGEIRGGRMG